MSDILKGVVGKSAFLIPWIFASALGLGAASLLLIPTQINLHLAGPIELWDSTTRGLVLATSVIVLGFTLGAASTPLYRLLEGYVGPKRLREYGAKRQQNAKWRLKSRISQLRDQTDLDASVLYEALSRFPDDDKQILPTRLGNAIRAFETYGFERYRLESQTLWFELISVSPKKLQDELDNSRAATDFFVAIVYISFVYGLAALTLTIAEFHQPHGSLDVSLLIQSGAAGVVVPMIAYRLAVSSTTYWATTVRAMVNLGRLKLAQTMGLKMPVSLEEERKMWEALTAFVFYPYSEYSAEGVDTYRSADTTTPVNLQDGTGGDQQVENGDDDEDDQPGGDETPSGSDDSHG